jgi:predicted PurR-regulated permease PerM
MAAPLKQYPFYIKSTVIIFGLTLTAYALFNLRGVFAPIAFSLIMAMLLNPLANKLQQKGLGKLLAISLSMLFGFLLIAGVMYFISDQIMHFSDNLPALKIKFNQHLVQIHHWIAINFNLPVSKQQKMVSDAMSDSKALVGSALGGVLNTVGFFVLVPVYIFLFLFYKNLFLNFFHESFSEDSAGRVSEVLNETKKAIQSYMVGLLLEALVVAVLNSVALLILGVDYAILLGIICALVNMLPYIGGIVATLLPMLVASVTKDGLSVQIGIVIANVIIQFTDNHFLVPLLVSSRVKINAFFSIVIVLLGGALWGVAGMFLSIPFLAILKIIFDRLPEMKPWGKLLGDEVPTRRRIGKQRKKKESVAEKIVDRT